MTDAPGKVLLKGSREITTGRNASRKVHSLSLAKLIRQHGERDLLVVGDDMWGVFADFSPPWSQNAALELADSSSEPLGLLRFAWVWALCNSPWFWGPSRSAELWPQPPFGCASHRLLPQFQLLCTTLCQKSPPTVQEGLTFYASTAKSPLVGR